MEGDPDAASRCKATLEQAADQLDEIDAAIRVVDGDQSKASSARQRMSQRT
jgi:hypothetical protein